MKDIIVKIRQSTPSGLIVSYDSSSGPEITIKGQHFGDNMLALSVKQAQEPRNAFDQIFRHRFFPSCSTTETPMSTPPENLLLPATALIERMSRLEENYDGLADRIEALEATQHAHADVSRLSDAEQDRLAQELAKPADWRPLKIETTYGSEPAADAAQILSPRMVVEGTFEHGGETYCFKANPERDDRPAPVRSADSLVEQNAPTVKESLTHALAGSLVERVADAIYRNGTGDGFREEARAAIREVAKWLRSEYPKREGYGTA